MMGAHLPVILLVKFSGHKITIALDKLHDALYRIRIMLDKDGMNRAAPMGWHIEDDLKSHSSLSEKFILN